MRPPRREQEVVHWIQHESGRVEHRFEALMLALALLVVPVILLDDAEPHGAGHVVAEVGNWVIWAAFVAELAVVLKLAPRRKAALRAHLLEAAIVVVSFPVLTGLFAVSRLARLVRLLRLGLFGTTALRTERRVSSARAFRLVGVVTLILVLSAGFAVSLVDTHDFPNAWVGVWWAIVTITTVGYGDVVPHTVLGRILAIVLMLGGIGFLSILTATIASAFVRLDAASPGQGDVPAELRAIREQLDRLEQLVTERA